MGKFLHWMGGFALGLTILFTALIGWGLVQRRQYKKTAVPYIRQVFPAMVPWNPLGAKRHMAPQALVGTTDAEFEKLLAWFSRLGKLKNFAEPKFLNVTAGATPPLGLHKTVRYQINAHFENGDALLTILLVEKSETCSILACNVNAPALMGSPT